MVVEFKYSYLSLNLIHLLCSKGLYQHCETSFFCTLHKTLHCSILRTTLFFHTLSTTPGLHSSRPQPPQATNTSAFGQPGNYTGDISFYTKLSQPFRNLLMRKSKWPVVTITLRNSGTEKLSVNCLGLYRIVLKMPCSYLLFLG